MPQSKPETTVRSDRANLYNTDFYAWTQAQATLLRCQDWLQLDLPNLIEEIEALGKQQRQELRNRLSILISHLLKWEYQAARRSRSWLATLRVQRLDIADLLADNPSLQPDLDTALERAYRRAVALAAGETDLPASTFPTECGYNLSDILDRDFYPGEPSEGFD
ncbi:MAG: DUF29 domain-containing protein [Spirulinaceae cyanobacterium SM2_1_0]|nr:DUF29 domain-containing protein [Spirulinaceae cyanobacterium SM2_1_0]